jgi:hypothetical protein
VGRATSCTTRAGLRLIEARLDLRVVGQKAMEILLELGGIVSLVQNAAVEPIADVADLRRDARLLAAQMLDGVEMRTVVETV